MARVNPYQYTLPTPPALFVGRWPLVDDIVTSLCSPQLDSWIVIGGRRFGKSSILRAISVRLAERLSHHRPGDWCVLSALINLQGSETESVQQVYVYILIRLYDALSEYTDIAIDLSPTQLHALALGEVEKLPFRRFELMLKDLVKHCETKIGPTRFVLLLDEVEHATNFPWHTTLFSQLRSLVYDSPLVGIVKLVLTGSARVVRVRETGSPLLNALKLHYLEPLLPDAIDQLIAHGGVMPEAAAQAIFEQSGGHPFIAQYLLHYLWDPVHLFSWTTSEQVTQVAHQMCLTRPDFQGWWEAIDESGRATYTILARHQHEVDERMLIASLHDHALSLDQALRNLSYHGLIVRNAERNRYRIAGTLFREWYLRNATSVQSATEVTVSYALLTPLRELLSELYGTIEDARRMLEDCGLKPAYIGQDDKPINYWSNILAEAHKQSKVRSIVSATIAEYPSKSVELEQTYQVYLNSVQSS